MSGNNNVVHKTPTQMASNSLRRKKSDLEFQREGRDWYVSPQPPTAAAERDAKGALAWHRHTSGRCGGRELTA